MDIKEKILLNSLDRLKKIRHDANYRGFRISVNQAQEIITFWDKCAIEIMKIIMNDLKSQLYWREYMWVN